MAKKATGAHDAPQEDTTQKAASGPEVRTPPPAREPASPEEVRRAIERIGYVLGRDYLARLSQEGDAERSGAGTTAGGENQNDPSRGRGAPRDRPDGRLRG
jgi:hypothetical protein